MQQHRLKFTVLAIFLLGGALWIFLPGRSHVSDEAAKPVESEVGDRKSTRSRPIDAPSGPAAAVEDATANVTPRVGGERPDFSLPNPSEIPDEIKAEVEANVRTRISQHHAADLRQAPFFNGLSRERQIALLDAMANSHFNFQERIRQAAMRGERLSPQAAAEIRREGQDQVRSILSEEEYEQFTEHQVTAPDRNLIGQLNSQLPLPINEDVNDGLMTIFREERERMISQAGQGGNDPHQLRNDMSSMTERVLARAGNLLNAEEIQALDTVLDRLIGPPREPQK